MSDAARGGATSGHRPARVRRPSGSTASVPLARIPPATLSSGAPVSHLRACARIANPHRYATSQLTSHAPSLLRARAVAWVDYDIVADVLARHKMFGACARHHRVHVTCREREGGVEPMTVGAEKHKEAPRSGGQGEDKERTSRGHAEDTVAGKLPGRQTVRQAHGHRFDTCTLALPRSS